MLDLSMELAAARAILGELHLENDELRAELTALRERMRWVPVGERLPMDLLNRNVMDAQGNVGTARQRLPYAAGIWDKTGSETLGMITHWKDLPEGFDTGLCASCCGTGLTDLHYCDGVIFQPRLCPCGCPRPLPAAPEVQTVARTGRECPNCDNDEVFSDGDDQFEGTLHQCEQCGKWAAISVTTGRYALVDAPEVPQ